MSAFAIELLDLKKTVRSGFWGKKVEILRGISLAVEVGKVFGFVGPNGSGKSTTIKHLIGASRPTSGTVQVFGHSPAHGPTRGRIGYLPELPRLPDTLSPRELIRMHAGLAGLSADEGKKRCESLLDRVSLLHRGDDRVSGFSKGMQQRVGLALALVGGPELLILDEPMTGLDPVGRRLVRDVILEEKSRGVTVFFSSHVLPDVESLCDEIGVLVDGEMKIAGSLQEIMDASVLGFELLLDGKGRPPESLGTISQRGESWVVQCAPGDDAVDTAVAAKNAGYEVRSIETVRAHLEDLLVELIEDDEATKRASITTDEARP